MTYRAPLGLVGIGWHVSLPLPAKWMACSLGYSIRITTTAFCYIMLIKVIGKSRMRVNRGKAEKRAKKANFERKVVFIPGLTEAG